MTKVAPILLKLSDYGWCDYDRIILRRCNVAEDVIRAYLGSDAFGTPFSSGNGGTDKHGPFLRTVISESDFELISLQQLEDEIRAICFSEKYSDCYSPPVSNEQWQLLHELISQICSRNTWFFALRLTLSDTDLYDERRNVLTVFHEFIGASPNSEFAERLVFGWD
jgi:hypothetical protein